MKNNNVVRWKLLAFHMIFKVSWLGWQDTSVFFRGFPSGWETFFSPWLFKQQIKIEHNSYYNKKFIFELVSKTVSCGCECLSVLWFASKITVYRFVAFSKALSLISSWLQELMINFALNFLYEEVIPLTFPITKFLILFVDAQNECSHSVVLGRCD